MERTFVFLKPDAVERKIAGELISRFEKKGYAITSLKMMQIDRATAKEHYAHVQHLSIYGEMMDFITSGPVIAMILEGEKVVQTVRNMIGLTSPFDSPAGTIRGDYGSHRYRNLIHASDSAENAEIEIKRFFRQ